MLTRRALIQAGLAAAGFQRAIRASEPPLTRYITVDDFQEFARQGEWYYSCLGDRGRVNVPAGGTVALGDGSVTGRLTANDSFAGMYFPIQHTQREALPVDFSANLPREILPEWQGRFTGFRVRIANGRGRLLVELEPPRDGRRFSVDHGPLGRTSVAAVTGLALGQIQNMNWVLRGSADDFVVIERIELEGTYPAMPLPERLFLWNFAMLLANLDYDTGLVRDRATFPSGDFDAVQATGMLAAAAAEAYALGFVSKASAQDIAGRIAAALLKLPRCEGVLPHFVTKGSITRGTEFSTVDTVLALYGTVLALHALDMDASPVESLITAINWQALTNEEGRISHGFDEDSKLLTDRWGDFGTETYLVLLGLAGATGRIGAMDGPPTFNGSAFITHLAWLLFPPPGSDVFGLDWTELERSSAQAQIDYYAQHPCYGTRGLFGLSAAEVPRVTSVPETYIYQPFGIGGKGAGPNDGTALLGYPVVVPHASAMMAAIRPNEVFTMWEWMEREGLFNSHNNAESFAINGCTSVARNSLRGSWNLALQTLGFGRALLLDHNPLYAALAKSEVLSRGYRVLTETR